MTQDYKKHNKIYKEIQDLCPKFSWYYKLSDHEKQEAINNTLLKLLDKERDGVIKLEVFDEYKGYLFIVLKNAIARILQSRNTIPHKSRIRTRELEPGDSFYTPSIPIRLDLSGLTPLNRAIFRWYSKGWLQRELADAVGMSQSAIGHRLTKMRKDLLKQLN